MKKLAFSLVCLVMGTPVMAQIKPTAATGSAPGKIYITCMKNIYAEAKNVPDAEFKKQFLDHAAAACTASEGTRQ
jgi:hypothetical protein